MRNTFKTFNEKNEVNIWILLTVNEIDKAVTNEIKK